MKLKIELTTDDIDLKGYDPREIMAAFARRVGDRIEEFPDITKEALVWKNIEVGSWEIEEWK